MHSFLIWLKWESTKQYHNTSEFWYRDFVWQYNMIRALYSSPGSCSALAMAHPLLLPHLHPVVSSDYHTQHSSSLQHTFVSKWYYDILTEQSTSNGKWQQTWLYLASLFSISGLTYSVVPTCPVKLAAAAAASCPILSLLFAASGAYIASSANPAYVHSHMQNITSRQWFHVMPGSPTAVKVNKWSK